MLIKRNGSTFSCRLCSNSFHVDLKNEHHKVPQAFGGTDDYENLITLCPTCHQTLHRIAEMWFNPKRQGKMEYTMLSYATNNCPNNSNALSFLRELVQCAYTAEYEYKKGNVVEYSEDQISFVLPQKYKKLFAQSCKLNGMSMQKQLECMAYKLISDKFPSERGNILPLLGKAQKKGR